METIHIRMNDEEMAHLRRYAKKCNMTLIKYVHFCVREAISFPPFEDPEKLERSL
jgi:hypothetical protein